MDVQLKRRYDLIPIVGASDRIVPKRPEAGYDLTYRRFRGGHVVARETSAAAARWFLDGLD